MADAPNPEPSLDAAVENVVDISSDFVAHAPLLVAGVVVLAATWAAANLFAYVARRVLDRQRGKRGFKDLVRELGVSAVWVIGLLVTAVVVFPGMTPTKALAGLGIGSVALGFAFKDIVENFLAGVLILWRFPFDPGDYIRMGDMVGRVEQITVRMTLIRQVDGELVILPNAALLKQPVNVLTDLPHRRVTVICGVAYGEDVDAARAVIEQAVNACDTIDTKRPVEVFAQEFASSSINFEVTWWTDPTPTPVRKSRDQVVAAVKRALDEAGIEIPFPYRTLTFKQPLKLGRAQHASHDESDGGN